MVIERKKRIHAKTTSPIHPRGTDPMADLIAQGPDRSDRWRRPLPTNESVTLGRGQDGWGVSWDNRISRQHAKLHWKDSVLQVEAIPDRPNPIFFQGEPASRFSV